jgi:dTDP-4-dehydrorhamnose 3,5-epimerase
MLNSHGLNGHGLNGHGPNSHGLKSHGLEGVVVRELTRHEDERGWLAELFRADELKGDLVPRMAYVSSTEPGRSRGPHEHREQTDIFCFIGTSEFKIYNRKDSKTYGQKAVVYAGERRPTMVIVPPGVVHAYKNTGATAGLVFNAPNSLFRGHGRKQEVDEIRYEDAPDSGFSLD